MYALEIARTGREINMREKEYTASDNNKIGSSELISKLQKHLREMNTKSWKPLYSYFQKDWEVFNVF